MLAGHAPGVSETCATALIFPSLCEGFGLPILEAMACGCPVITSNLSSMPEVAGQAALLIDPYSVPGIAEAMTNLSLDEELRRRLIEAGRERARGFTWEATARLTLEGLERLATQPSPPA